jgi:hypothetical protein
LSRPLRRLFLSVPVSYAKRRSDDWGLHRFRLADVDEEANVDPELPMSLRQSESSDDAEDEAASLAGGASKEPEAAPDDDEAEIESALATERMPTKISPWDPSVWDSWVDPATLPFQTRDNRPVLCVAAWEHICVAGKGRRRGGNNGHRRGDAARRGWSDTGSFSSVGRSASSWGGGSSKNRAASSIPATDRSGATIDRDFDGGFVTFFSMRTFSQVRTLYLPFEPRDISPFVWGRMSFVLVLGRRAHEAVAIRVDANGIIALASGESPGTIRRSESATSTHSRESLRSGSAKLQSAAGSDRAQAIQPAPEITLRRFQMLAIDMPDTEDLTPLVGGCEMRASPPSLVLVFVDDHEGQISIMRRTFKGVVARSEVTAGHASFAPGRPLITMPTIGTEHSIEKTARFTLPPGTLSLGDDRAARGVVWCKSGQGWSTIGVSHRRYVVCWDGATNVHGAFVAEIGSDDEGMESHQALVGHVLPLDPYSKRREEATPEMMLPFTGPSRRSIFIRDVEEHRLPSLGFSSSSNKGAEALDGIVVEALRNISSQSYRASVIPGSAMVSQRRASAFSHREKSEILLRQCSSWTQLESSSAAHSLFASQLPVLSTRVFGFNSRKSTISLLSLRKAPVANGHTSPFQQVLSWLLTEREDYFTAASIALDLLRDGASLRLLWSAFDKLDEDEELDNLHGLLDGVETPPATDEIESAQRSVTLTQLADMTVGCLTKGGHQMAPTLEYFLEFDTHYDASRASLMLVATAVSCVSQEEEALSLADDDVPSMSTILWPVRCLLKLASTRDTLVTVLLLLNAAIPDELRRRTRRGIAASSLPSLELCLSLITLIVSTSPDAPELLLNLIDESSGSPFWESISHETQLSLSLIETKGDYVMVRQPEVKAWIMQQVQKQLVSDLTTAQTLPTHWLQQIVHACLANAGCQSHLFADAGLPTEKSQMSVESCVQQFGAEIMWLRGAVTSERGSWGLDFDVLVPVLLILQSRMADWSVALTASALPPTQSLLNAVCYVAGRRSPDDEGEEGRRAPDMSTLMRQCALAHNVQAGAHLVGGSNGLVLECCDILVSELGLSINVAESFLLAETFTDVTPSKAPDRVFNLNTGHICLLWLLECHVLDVRTYGDFESTGRGRVDPVFAARLVFRSWFLLTRETKRDSNECLTGWLRQKLQMADDELSPRRLVCAALVRALLWPSDAASKRDLQCGGKSSTKTLLAAKLELSSSFLVSLTRSCLGMVEAIPPSLDGEMPMLSSAVNVSNTSLASRKDVSFLSARNNSFLNESADDSFASAASSLRELDA